MIDKFQLLDSIIVQLDALADARGVTRCATIVELVQKVTALRKGLADEDKAHAQTVEILEQQIKRLTEPNPEEGEEVIGGQTYVIGDENA